jgi:hypothetical protein
VARLRLETLRRNLKADRRQAARLEAMRGTHPDPTYDAALAALRSRIAATAKEVAERSRS